MTTGPPGRPARGEMRQRARPEGLLRLTRICLLLSAAAAASGCGPDAMQPQPLRVFAASSLTEAFQEMASAFENAYPDTEVVLVFAGSQVLRLQLEQGAQADIFSSADPRHMEALVQEGIVSGHRVLAENELVVIVPPGNPAGIESFAELANAERVVIGTSNVPVGVYAREALRRAETAGGLAGFEAAVMGRVVSEESNVRLVRAKVELGEADAAIVYRTERGAGACADGAAAVPGECAGPLPDRCGRRCPQPCRGGAVGGVRVLAGRPPDPLPARLPRRHRRGAVTRDPEAVSRGARSVPRRRPDAADPRRAPGGAGGGLITRRHRRRPPATRSSSPPSGSVRARP